MTPGIPLEVLVPPFETADLSDTDREHEFRILGINVFTRLYSQNPSPTLAKNCLEIRIECG